MYGMFQQPVNCLISVSGIDGARSYQLPPGSSVPLFDANEDIMYVKTTDAGGYPTIRAFKFEEISTNDKQDFITRKEFEELKEMINDAKQLIQEKGNAEQAG